MKQHILIQSYCGLSDFSFDVACTGRKLNLEEALRLNLTNQGELQRHEQSDYSADWYEINPGDQIEVHRLDDDGEKNVSFSIPPDGLSDPPVSLDDPRSGTKLLPYLE